MTFSIVATDGQAWGVAVASKFLAVGNAVPAARTGIGAIATQSYANLSYRPNGLALLEQGKTAQETLDDLTAADDLRAQRQAGIVDGAGRAATFTGEECHQWAGGTTSRSDDGAGYAIQGNILTGPEVVEAMERAWLASDPSEPLARRLLAALIAGDEAGGDRRGRQSAAVLVETPGGGYGGSDVHVDLRVDDHDNPVPELARLLDLHDILFGANDPADAAPLEGDLAAEVRGRLARLGHGDPDLDRALGDWAAIENLEERMVAGRIHPITLRVLRQKAP
jgi:uncharacterized Ntn-hydrolase superfamily protein